MISIIAAVADNGAIGAGNALLWHLPDDLKRFKRLTTGHTVIMGRKTFESLPKGALPNRTNVVITSVPQTSFPSCETFGNLRDAINSHQQEEEIFIIGGALIYKEAIGFANKLYITCVHHNFGHADAFFPAINESDWEQITSEHSLSDEKNKYSYTFKVFLRKNNCQICFN